MYVVSPETTSGGVPNNFGRSRLLLGEADGSR